MSEALWFLLLPVATAGGFAAIVRRTRPHWARRRSLLVAAAPVPLALAAFATFIIVSAATSTKAQCGVDACGMATVAALFILACAAGTFLIGCVAAAAILRERRAP